MLGRPPVAAHASIVLHNWQRLDANGPIDLGNLGALQLFLGGMDEQWFYLVTVAIEAGGAPALPALVGAQQAVQSERVDDLAQHLTAIGCALASVTHTLLRMPERCDPYVFFQRVRPYLTGWPEPGIVYEGVSDAPQMCAGGSAAQSPLIQALDAGLGVRHLDGVTSPFLLDMRRYMSPLHRRFIEALEAGPSVRQFVLDRSPTHPALRDLYNDCVRGLEDFRQRHIEIAVRYITRQAAKGEEAKGTGGTNFGVFLGRARKETSEHEIA
jgi:indoleamine 2,3-dioxygenase